MPIDYRYHIGSFVAVFVALLLGILIGIGLAPNPTEFSKVVSGLKKEFNETGRMKDEELKALGQEKTQYESVAKEAVAGLIRDRLRGRRVAIILDHDFGHDPLPDVLRALMKESGATLVSTTTITRNFVAMPESIRRQISQRLNRVASPGVHFRSLVAEDLARDLAEGRRDAIAFLESLGVVKSSADSDYRLPVDSVLFVGGAGPSPDASPERIDLPLIAELLRLGVRVVGCESSLSDRSSIPLYKSKGIPTVDNADMLSGRMSAVLCLAGATGHFGVKETADRFLPALATTGPP